MIALVSVLSVLVSCDKSVLRVLVSCEKSLLMVLVRFDVLDSPLPEFLPEPQLSEREPLLADVPESPLFELELELELEPQLSEPLLVVLDVPTSLLPDVLDVPESPLLLLLEEDESEPLLLLLDDSELLLLLLLLDDSQPLLLLLLLDDSQPLPLLLHSPVVDVPPPPAVVDSAPLPRLLLPWPVPFQALGSIDSAS